MAALNNSKDQFDRSVDPTHDAIARAGCGLVVGLLVGFAVLTHFWPISPWVAVGIVAAHVLIALFMRRSWWRAWLGFITFWS